MDSVPKYSFKESLVSDWIENQEEITLTKLRDYTIQFESSISSVTCERIIGRLVALGFLIPQDNSRCPIYKPSKTNFNFRRLNKKRILNALLKNDSAIEIQDFINFLTDKFCNISSIYIQHLLDELTIDGFIAMDNENSTIFLVQGQIDGGKESNKRPSSAVTADEESFSAVEKKRSQHTCITTGSSDTLLLPPPEPLQLLLQSTLVASGIVVVTDEVGKDEEEQNLQAEQIIADDGIITSSTTPVTDTENENTNSSVVSFSCFSSFSPFSPSMPIIVSPIISSTTSTSNNSATPSTTNSSSSAVDRDDGSFSMDNLHTILEEAYGSLGEALVVDVLEIVKKAWPTFTMEGLIEFLFEAQNRGSLMMPFEYINLEDVKVCQI